MKYSESQAREAYGGIRGLAVIHPRRWAHSHGEIGPPPFPPTPGSGLERANMCSGVRTTFRITSRTFVMPARPSRPPPWAASDSRNGCSETRRESEPASVNQDLKWSPADLGVMPATEVWDRSPSGTSGLAAENRSQGVGLRPCLSATRPVLNIDELLSEQIWGYRRLCGTAILMSKRCIPVTMCLAQHWTSNLEGFPGGLGNPTDSTGLN